jgi:hypothetical protein
VQLFWNRSIDRVLLMPDAGPIDIYRDERVRVAKDGSLLAGGKAFRGPLLVDGFGSFIRLRGAVPVERSRISTLWRPVGTPRLALYAPGRYHDGWLANSGAVYVWPGHAGAELSGWISMRLTAPRSLGAMTLTFAAKGERTRIRLRAGTPRLVRIPVCSRGNARVTFRSNVRGFVGLRIVSARATAPVFTPSLSACAHRPASPGGVGSNGAAV